MIFNMKKGLLKINTVMEIMVMELNFHSGVSCSKLESKSLYIIIFFNNSL